MAGVRTAEGARPRRAAAAPRPRAVRATARRAASRTHDAAGYEAMRWWGLTASVLLAAAGAAVALGDAGGLLGRWEDGLAARFFPHGPAPDALAMRDFLYVPLGAASAARWLLVGWLFHEPLRRRERWAHRAVVWSVAVGLVLDGVPSAYQRAWFELAWVSAWPVALLAVPLWRMRAAVA